MRERFLEQALATVRDRYDLALVDCPPNLGLLTVNGLIAADRLVVPVNMQDEGACKECLSCAGRWQSSRRAGRHASLTRWSTRELTRADRSTRR